MIKLNGEIVNINHFPDGTLLLKEEGKWAGGGAHKIEWHFENNEELVMTIQEKLIYRCRIFQMQDRTE